MHKWRSEEQSILVGKETALYDNPQLNVRLWEGKDPIRIVIDSKLLLPESLNLFNHEIETIIFNSIKTEEQKNISFVKLNFKTPILNQLLSHLYSKIFNQLLLKVEQPLYKNSLTKICGMRHEYLQLRKN